MKKTYTLLVVVILTVNVFAQIPNYFPVNGLVGYYPFNGNANDASVLGNNGTINGATLTSDRNSSANSAYYFDGTNDNIIAAPISAITNSVSISLWIKNDNNSGEWNGIITNQPNSNGGFLLQEHSSNKYDWAVAKGGGYNDLWSVSSITNQWDHFVCIIYNNQMKIYINGSLDNSSNIGSSILSSSGNLCFGSRYSNEWFKGKLDDIGIWNRALTQQEITGLYNSCTPGASPNTSTDTQTACDSYTWMDGNTYTASNNIATHTLTNAAGCDSVVTLNLTINQSDSSFTTVTACDSYTWNDSTYTQSGTYSYNSVVNNSNNSYSGNFNGGNDYINIGRPLNLYNGNVGSFSVWFKSTASTGDRVFISNDTQPTNPELNFGLVNGFVYVSGGPSTPKITSTNTYTDGLWHHAVAIKSGSNCVELYVDNQYIGINCSGSGNMDTGDNYFIGDNRTSGQKDYIGLLDEFRIYDKVLSSTEVSDLFNYNCGGGAISNLVAYYDFEAGSGSMGGMMQNMTNPWNTNVPAQTCVASLTNINGCDSVATLNLTINQSDSSFTTVTACDSYTWNDSTYTQSGTYSYNSVSGSASNNYSMSFDGVNDRISIPHNSDFNVPEMSVLVKVLPNSFGPSEQYIIDKSIDQNPGAVNRNWAIRISGGGGLTVEMRIDGIYYTFGSTQTLNLGVWNTLALTYDGQNIKLLHDNVEVISQSISGQLSNSTYPISLGFFPHNNMPPYGYFWNGLIDDPQIWNTALTQQEIQNYMNCPPTGNETGLVGYWDFEEGTGTTVYDQTVNGNNGTVNGATYDANVTSFPSCLTSLTNTNGCDSVATLNLTINPTYFTQVSATICDDAVYAFNGNTYNQTGIYLDTLQGQLSCDSIIETNLTVNPTYFTQASATICDDAVYTFNGNTYNQTGVYLDTLQSALSCDSVIETNLTVNPTYFTQASATICDDAVYAFNGNSYTQTGIYLDTLQSALSCDSVIETNLTVNPTYFTQVAATICDDAVYAFNGNSYTQTGVYLDTLQGQLSCDSVIETNLTVNPTYFTQASATICDDAVYTFNGNTYNQTGVYLDTLSSVLTCDSVIETTLTVNPTYFTQVSATICDDAVYAFNGNSYTQTGVYLDTLQSALTCDSVIETTLNVRKTSATSLIVDTCSGIFSITGKYFDATGIYLDTILNHLGCDSIISYDLTINPLDNSVSVNLNNAPTMLIANDSSANYQWLSCDFNFAKVQNEISQTFTASINGSYAVEVSRGDCRDTSDCYLVQNVGLENNFVKSEIKLYPNPTNGIVTIDAKQFQKAEVFDATGRLMLTSKSNIIDLKRQATGLYLIKVHTKGIIEEFKVLRE